MGASEPRAVAGALSPAQIAKAALRRLALAQLEPTPDNYARAWAEEAGQASPLLLPERARPLVERLAARFADDASARDAIVRHLMHGHWEPLQQQLERGGSDSAAAAQSWATLIDRLTRGLERGGRQWTSARKKDSLHRVLEGSRSDLQRLQQRLKQLVASWDGEGGDTVSGVETAFDEATLDGPAPTAPAALTPIALTAPADVAAPTPPAQHWQPLLRSLGGTVLAALPGGDARAAELADELKALADRIALDGATPALAQAVDAVCQRTRRLLAHRQHLLDALGRLCRELTGGLTELAEDGSWARGQAELLANRLDDGLSARGIRAAGELLAHTRAEQQRLRAERDRARDALKGLMHSLLQQMGALGEQTGRFSDSLTRYAGVIESADSIDSLAGLVREMVEESRGVQALVQRTHQRLHDEQVQAGELEARVRELEGELRRLSDEVSTDALTQVANRRGLQQAFDTERARLEREGSALAVGLIDIDNFKKLNDSLGHAAGDRALQALAARVRDTLRPVDHVARFGGEEFVVLLPGTAVDDGRQVLSRLQRELTASLFMHEAQEVFVTFSAGVTAYRPGEALETALERADEALYEAKRTGKNRTCVA